MLRAIWMGFLTGLLAANALPHFLRGITAQEYPSVPATRRSATLSAVGYCWWSRPFSATGLAWITTRCRA
jgi:hypothetical protein